MSIVGFHAVRLKMEPMKQTMDQGGENQAGTNQENKSRE